MAVQTIMIRTGVANTASIEAALRRAGADVTMSERADDVARASFVVLPGVGAFGAGMEALRMHGLAEVLRERILDGRPTLCVCLGLQLLCRDSEETPGVEGLGVLPVSVKRFSADSADLRIPQLGWNRVEALPGCRFLQTGFAYFANSYRIADIPAGWTGAAAEYGGRFTAALERDGVLCCQFHPELSSAWGAALLSRWLERGGASC